MEAVSHIDLRFPTWRRQQLSTQTQQLPTSTSQGNISPYVQEFKERYFAAVWMINAYYWKACQKWL